MTTEVNVNDFIEHVGPNVDINPLVAREIDYFYELIPESYFEEKAKQRNLYHYQFWPAKGVELMDASIRRRVKGPSWMCHHHGDPSQPPLHNALFHESVPW